MIIRSYMRNHLGYSFGGTVPESELAPHIQAAIDQVCTTSPLTHHIKSEAFYDRSTLLSEIQPKAKPVRNELPTHASMIVTQISSCASRFLGTPPTIQTSMD